MTTFVQRLTFFMGLLFCSQVSAGFLDDLKKITEGARDTIADVTETVKGTKDAKKETEDLINQVRYNDTLTLNESDALRLQAQLNQLGYDVGTPDGKIGNRTRQGIASFKPTVGLAADGSIDVALINALQTATTGGTVVEQTAASNTNANTTLPTTSNINAPLSKSEWRELQSNLNQAGYSVGTADGIPGPRTERAVSAYARSYGLTESARSVFQHVAEANQQIASTSNQTTQVAAEDSEKLSEAPDTQLPDYLKPQMAPQGSGLPDGLAWHDGAIVVGAPNRIPSFKTNKEIQLALRKLNLKTILQANNGRITNKDNALLFGDLSGEAAQTFFVTEQLDTAATTSFRSLNKLDENKNTDAFDSHVVTDWKPQASVFDTQRLQQRYLDEVAPNLLQQPIRLPFDIVLLEPVEIKDYSFERGGFPLSLYGRGRFNFSNLLLDRQYGISQAEQQLQGLLQPILPMKGLPDLWPIAPDDAEPMSETFAFTPKGMIENFSDEQIQELIKKDPSIKNYITASAYLAYRMRVNSITLGDTRNSELLGPAVLDVAAVSLTLYRTPRLDDVLTELPLPEDAITAPAMVNTASENKLTQTVWKFSEPKRLTPDNLRMLYVQAAGEEVSDTFWGASAEQRRIFERLLSKNSWQSFKALPPYWEVGFPRSTLNSRNALNTQQINDYKNWTLARLPHLGDRFYAASVPAQWEDGKLVTRNATDSVVSNLVGLSSSNGLKQNYGNERERRAQIQQITALANEQYPSALDVVFSNMGNDLKVAFVLQESPIWYDQQWMPESADVIAPLSSGYVHPTMEIVVQSKQAVALENGLVGLIVEIAPRALSLDIEGNRTLLKPVENTSAPTAALDILGVELGMSQTQALEILETALKSELVVREVVRDDDDIKKAVYVSTSDNESQGLKNALSLFFNPADDSLVAISRTLTYKGLGIKPIQIIERMRQKYGDEVKNHDNQAVGWAHGAVAKGKMKESYNFNNDCLKIGVSNRRMGNSSLSPMDPDGPTLDTSRLKAGCGEFLIAKLDSRRDVTTTLLANSDVLNDLKIQRQMREAAEAEKEKEAKVESLAF